MGRVLASAPGVFYVHEPLNPTFAPHYLRQTDLPFYLRITPAQSPQFATAFDRLLSGQFPRLDGHFFRPDRRYVTRFFHAFTFRWAALRGKRFLLKDPFVLFNIRWMETRYAARTVLLIRHPCAFVASLKVKNWTFDFRQWTDQPALLEGPLAPFRTEIEAAARHQPDIVDQGCLLWNCLTRETLALADADDQRILLRHEDLCTAPIEHFQEVFGQLNLPWTPATEHLLRDPRHDPRKQLDTWKKRLDLEEIRRILKATGELRTHHYPDTPSNLPR